MIDKIYRYRPLSELLFKELKYCELYFSSYLELNDPLDLSAKINFRPQNAKQLEYLIYFLIKNSIIASLRTDSTNKSNYIQEMVKLSDNYKLKREICNYLYRDIVAHDSSFVPYEIIENSLKTICRKFQIEFNLRDIKYELQRITQVFFESSYVSCFSETCTDFLMWSHYASKHSGICIGFSLNQKQQFPYFFSGPRKSDNDKYSKKFSEWEFKGCLYWDDINKVEYREELPAINFYDFAPIFENENDCDLMELSKSRWHGYAYKLKKIFAVKTLPWKYEKEWRAIEISFGELKQPEERIRQYPIEAVSEIYFGIRTPSKVKKRIYKLLNSMKEDIKYYECVLSNSKDLNIKKWIYEGE